METSCICDALLYAEHDRTPNKGVATTNLRVAPAMPWKLLQLLHQSNATAEDYIFGHGDALKKLYGQVLTPGKPQQAALLVELHPSKDMADDKGRRLVGLIVPHL